MHIERIHTIHKTKILYRNIVWVITIALLLMLQVSVSLAMSEYLPKYLALDADQNTIYFLEEFASTQQDQTEYHYLLWRSQEDHPLPILLTDLRSPDLSYRPHLSGMAWDPIGRQLVFADLQHKEIFTFDPETGRRAIISNRNIGNGIEFGELGGFVVDSVEHRIIMLDKGANQDGTKRWLTQVSFDTGNRRALYSRATDAIQEISEYSLALDPYTHQLFVSHQGQIIALALASGNVSILTDSQQEASNVDRINGSAAIAFDFNRHQLIVSDPLLKNLTSVNVATGQRTRLLPETNDETPSLCWPQALLVVGDKVWIGDQGHADWVSLDLNSGTLGSLLPNANRPHSRCKSTAPVGNTRLETQPNNRPAQYSTSLPVIDSTAQQASAQVVAPTTFQGKFSAIWRIFGSGPMPVP